MRRKRASGRRLGTVSLALETPEQDDDRAASAEVGASRAKGENVGGCRRSREKVGNLALEHAATTGRVMSSTDDDEHELAAPFTLGGDEARNAAARRIDVVTVKVERRSRSAAKSLPNVRGGSAAIALDPLVISLDLEARSARERRPRTRNP